MGNLESSPHLLHTQASVVTLFDFHFIFDHAGSDESVSCPTRMVKLMMDASRRPESTLPIRDCELRRFVSSAVCVCCSGRWQPCLC